MPLERTLGVVNFYHRAREIAADLNFELGRLKRQEF